MRLYRINRIPLDKRTFLVHHGVIGQKKGQRNGPPYPLKRRQLSSKYRKTVQLPSDEYAHVMSEIASNIKEEEKDFPTLVKRVGNYVYTVENNGFGNYRVIGKRKNKSSDKYRS